MMEMSNITGALEAILYVSGDPVQIPDIAHAMNLTTSEMEEAIAALRDRMDVEHSGLQLNRHGDELQLSVRSEFSAFVEMYLQPVTQKSLSQSVMETLSIIAYRQPITKAEIEAVRGVKCDYSIQSLQDKGFIEEAGRKETLGRPILYKTTDEFLRHFGIETLEQLPIMEKPAEATLNT